jgi:uncharacterized delta-60 repeat protein
MPSLPRRVAATLTLCLAVVAVSAGTAVAGPGDLDPTFDADGSAFVPLSDNQELRIATPRVAQAPDGTLVAAAMLNDREACQLCETMRGRTRGELHVVRLNQAGQVTDQADFDVSGQILDIRVLADGTIAIVWRDRPDQLLLVWLTPELDYIDDAFRDASDSCDTDGELADAAIRADGKVVAAWNCGGDLVELLDDTLDPVEGFDDSGLDELNPIEDLALSPSGVIHILTSSETKGANDVRVSRLLADGPLDVSYGQGGEALYAGLHGPASGPRPFPPNSGDGAPLAVDSTGRAVVALNTDTLGRWEHVRFTPAGELDEAGFGVEGLSVVESELIAGQPTHVTIQHDDKILSVGYEISALTRGAGDGNGIVLVRLETNGTPDLGFGDAGFVHLQPDAGNADLDPPGPVLEQVDGRLVLPSAVPIAFVEQVPSRAAVPTPPAGETYLALLRLGDVVTPPAPPAPPRPVQQVQQQSTPPACVSRRAFRIRIRERSSRPIRRAVVRVDGKRVKVARRGGRLSATVRLATLPKGRFSVKITVRYRDGGKRSYTRRYRTCDEKLPPSNKLAKKNAL